jgi:hypothetical protein
MASPNQAPSATENAHASRPARDVNLVDDSDLTIDEIMALPEERRNEIAKRLGVICWEPFTVQAICTPGDVYVSNDLPEIKPIPDYDDDEDDADENVEDGQPATGEEDNHARNEGSNGKAGGK